MPKKLAIVTGSGLLLCAAFLGSAIVIGGDDVFHDARSLKEVRPLIDLATHKTWRWSGGDTLALDAPMNIRYRPKDAPGVLVTGPEDLLKHVHVSDGRIASDTSVTHSGGKRLDAVVSGVAIRKFIVNNNENLDLGEIDQPGLDLHLNGSGTVTGHGKVDQLNLTIAGPGKANLGGLSVMGDAKISILGSGGATLSPHGRVKLFIAGSGNLQLLTKPTELRQTIVGSGEVNQLTGEALKNALGGQYSYKYGYAYNYDYSYKSGRPPDTTKTVTDNAQAQAEAERQLPVPPAVVENANGSAVFLRGSGNTNLGHIEQKSLKITVASSGSITAEGKVDELSISILGSGNAKLGKLAARSVTVQVMGSGSATVAPGEDLKVSILGSGDVHLLTRPASIQRQIMGSGRIIEEH